MDARTTKLYLASLYQETLCEGRAILGLIIAYDAFNANLMDACNTMMASHPGHPSFVGAHHHGHWAHPNMG